MHCETTPARHAAVPYRPSPEAMDAFIAMNPDCRPMSLTIEMPAALRASTRALMSERCASSTAVSKPKHRSICGRQQDG